MIDVGYLCLQVCFEENVESWTRHRLTSEGKKTCRWIDFSSLSFVSCILNVDWEGIFRCSVTYCFLWNVFYIIVCMPEELLCKQERIVVRKTKGTAYRVVKCKGRRNKVRLFVEIVILKLNCICFHWMADVCTWSTVLYTNSYLGWNGEIFVGLYIHAQTAIK